MTELVDIKGLDPEAEDIMAVYKRIESEASSRQIGANANPYPPSINEWPEAQKNEYFANQAAKYTAKQREASKIIHMTSKKARQKRVAGGWLANALVDGRGDPVPNLANVMIVLREVRELDVFAFDEMQREPMLLGSVPGGSSSGSFPRPVQDTDVSQLQEWLQLAGLLKVTYDTVHQAVDQRARECRYHPVQAYLEPLKWDGKPRLSNWLARYIGADQTPYHARIGRMFLIALVARVYEPGCKADYMLVLEGGQGAGKSTACSILAGKWFSDSLPDVSRDKEASQHLRGKWLVEIAELSATNKSEAEAIKAFITRPTERYRPPWGRREVVEHRQCLFIGTTNQDEYLRDETGARRFWPVKVGKIDLDALSRDREQLFAEAVHVYRAGETWWPDEAFEQEHIKPEQEVRRETDPWEDIIREYADTRERVTASEIALHVLAIERGKIGTREHRRIRSILTVLGWRPVRDWRGRGFVKP
jgi:predicted P-loop ATPase